MRTSNRPPLKGYFSGRPRAGHPPRAGRFFLPALLLCLIISLTACAGREAYVRPDPTNPVYTVAVLPFYNASNDVDGPRMIRKEFVKRLKGRHYSVMDLEQSDALLVDKMGITLGDQLEMTTPEALGEVLGVDAVIYGYVLNFDNITTGIYNMKKVRAGFKLVDTSTGEVMWARGLGVKAMIVGGDVGAGVTLFKELAGDDADEFGSIEGIKEIRGLDDWHIIGVIGTKKVGDAALMALSEKFITSAFGIHLLAETNVMLNRIMPGFPAGPGRASPQ